MTSRLPSASDPSVLLGPGLTCGSHVHLSDKQPLIWSK